MTTDPTADYLFVPHHLIGASQLERFEFESASKRHNQAVDIAYEEHQARMNYMRLEHEARMAAIEKEGELK